MPGLDVAIVGGGVTGLSTAFYLSRAVPHLRVGLIEARPRYGGLISTIHKGGFVFEEGPDSLVRSKPEGIQLVRDLGLEEDLVQSRQDQAGALLWTRGGLHPFPVGTLLRVPLDLTPFEGSSLLSEQGWRRALHEPQIPPGPGDDESVHSFFQRRFGSELAETLAAPLVAGVYGGDSRKISLQAAFPRLFEAEKKWGHVSGPAPQPASRPASPFVSLRGGLGTMIDALVEVLSAKIQLVTGRVEQIRQLSGGFSLSLGQALEIRADSVVLATQAPSAGKILSPSLPILSGLLNGIAYSPALIGCFGFSHDVTSHLAGTGLLVPPLEDPFLMAATWVHHKFPGRCPKGGAMIRCFLGSEAAAAWMGQSDKVLVRAFLAAIHRILGMALEPELAVIRRWPTGLPQYTAGHLQRIQNLSEELDKIPGLYCVGNYLDGVGISDAIRWGRNIAASISARLHP